MKLRYLKYLIPLLFTVNHVYACDLVLTAYEDKNYQGQTWKFWDGCDDSPQHLWNDKISSIRFYDSHYTARICEDWLHSGNCHNIYSHIPDLHNFRPLGKGLNNKISSLEYTRLDRLELHFVAYMDSLANNDVLAWVYSRINGLQDAFYASGLNVHIKVRYAYLSDEDTRYYYSNEVGDSSEALKFVRRHANKGESEFAMFFPSNDSHHFRSDSDKGIAFLISAGNQSDYLSIVKKLGYSWVADDARRETIAHELGHNLGLAHGNTSGEKKIKDYASGYDFKYKSKRYNTIMRDGSRMVNRFSDPKASCRNQRRCGKDNDRDAVRAMLETSLKYLREGT
ncbi:MAG: M12 family metallo-peptidase [Pseudomonadota bacterium]